MEQDILISIIVPVYNVEKYLPRCVDSILNQTYRNLEVILVDDGTKDSCDVICDAYAQKDSRVRVIHKENGGLSSARNAGIDIARGEYLGFVDSDDWIEPETYESLLELAKKYDVKLVCGGRYDADGATGCRTVGLCPEKEEVITGEEMCGRIFLWDQMDSAAVDKLYHRSLFENIRYPFAKVSEDVPTTYRIVLKAGQAALCPKPFYTYYHRPDSITTANISEKTFHFTQHTEQIYDDIRRNHPAIQNQARYLRVRALIHSAERVEQAPKEDRLRFAEQKRDAQRELRKHLGFVMGSPWFTLKEKIRTVFLACGLYRVVRNMCSAVR